MYRIDVEYLNIEGKFASMLFCNECDENATKEIFRHIVPTSGKTGIIGQTQYINLNHCMTDMRITIEEVEKDVKEIVESLKKGIQEKRSKTLKTEKYEF
jgi:hypothetical protein